MIPRYTPQARALLVKLNAVIEAAERNGEDIREIQYVLLHMTALVGLRHDQSLSECIEHARVGIAMAERARDESEAQSGVNIAELFTRKANTLLVALKSGL